MRWSRTMHESTECGALTRQRTGAKTEAVCSVFALFFSRRLFCLFARGDPIVMLLWYWLMCGSPSALLSPHLLPLRALTLHAHDTMACVSLLQPEPPSTPRKHTT